MSRFNVRQVAVLGAGVMGAQIAAHLVNVRVPVVLFDLPAKEGPKSAIALKAIENLKKLKPAPLGLAVEAARIRAANYEDDLALLAECDLVIEAIAERLDWKHALYEKIAPHIAPHAILASNTSGLSITALSEPLPEALKPRFCGIHFFNPPRYMQLVELIPTPTTEARYLDQLETFATTTLGKGVVRAKDTPNFIANRVGIAGMLSTMREAEQFGLSYDLVDDLTGKKLGRASSGTFRTADVVGLDTMAHVIRTMQDQLGPDRGNDPFHPSYATPPVLAKLIEQGALGQKAGAGFYRKVGRDIQRLDPAKGDYVASGAKAEPIIDRILKKAPAERLKLLRESTNPQAQFLWAILRNAFHYAAVHLGSIADSAREVDLAMRWGFGMQQGPFELWQAAGWQQVAGWVKADIDAGKALSSAPLPDWVFDGRSGVHTPEGSWSAAQGAYLPRPALPVYRRQHFPEALVGENAVPALKSGTEVFRNEEVRVWTLDGEVLIASIDCKLHLISPTVTAGLLKAVELAEASYQGLVIWSPDDVFSAGANLEALMPVFMKAGSRGIAPEEKKLQDLMLRVRYASVPVVAAMRGLALGGGCELAVHCARRVAAMESYVGLVEVGVGLIPGGGGLAYIARRAAEKAATAPGTDLLPFLKDAFQAAAMATVGTSALESRQLGYLQDADVIVAHKDELLHVALGQARALADAGYRPPQKSLIPVAGRSAIATIRASLVGMRDGGFISQHDDHIAGLIAEVVCGGEVDAGTVVTEEYLMALERQRFCALLEHPKTQERIMGMLQTGKPVRN
ncbi:MAG: 3-hydroxyacyl-CoA dehydrogenase/enoyl-CoA hydratase family protein [Sphaerotilus natans subsp. sulfidivorans]|uniref:3-hydroxyacyl-CoA dehydrogenase NAD-binding domain-containing protein n=1 Tax=Sphaerotilus sulfidivorans TaxID=639200 RepID=UPI002355B9E0|nr:3-hydroxyacyl-CoA dehydrogenase NAD-binding domain-containing protein [Sphaerotilus sulfidivorans]MCK6403182.1 3-hydroxyacyl-CoA dehydrogenase/enoyl-CoA hydratase family protein [Sphaerotilus sulfidivorans]